MDTDQLKPFDLEKAKAGKPFAHHLDPDWKIKFIGANSKGDIVYEYGLHGSVATAPPNDLRMLPEVKKFRGILYTIYGDRLKETYTMVDTEHNRDWAKRYNHEILTEFEVEYEEK